MGKNLLDFLYNPKFWITNFFPKWISSHFTSRTIKKAKVLEAETEVNSILSHKNVPIQILVLLSEETETYFQTFSKVDPNDIFRYDYLPIKIYSNTIEKTTTHNMIVFSLLHEFSHAVYGLTDVTKSLFIDPKISKMIKEIKTQIPQNYFDLYKKYNFSAHPEYITDELKEPFCDFFADFLYGKFESNLELSQNCSQIIERFNLLMKNYYQQL